MAKLEKTITVTAPVDKVFEYVSLPTNMPEIWPSLVEIKDLEPVPSGGYSWAYAYKMAGMRFEGTGQHIEHIPNQRTVSKGRGGIESTLTWTFQPDDGGTKVTFEAEYTVPVPLLGKLAEALIVRQNEGEAELLMANLKARMEA